MEFKFDNVFYEWDANGTLHLYFRLAEQKKSTLQLFRSAKKKNTILHLNGTRLLLEQNIRLSKAKKYDISFLKEEDKVIKEIRQNEMLQTFFLLKNDSIIKAFDAPDNTERGFCYTFELYSPDDEYYQEDLFPDYQDSEILNIDSH